MRLSTKFIFFIFVIHAVTIALSFYIFRENKLLFIASEFFIIISLMICWSLYTELIAPLNLLMTGIDALRDKDFNIKFTKTGKYEMDELIKVYNSMIDQLRTERTLQQEQHFFLEKLIQTSPTGIVILDFDGKITTMNPKATAIIPTSQRVFFMDFIRNMKKGDSQTLNTEGVKKYKIQKAEFIDKGFPRSFVMIEELTMEILEAEKQAYGKVIRMMAHEVNNSIGAVNSILDTTVQLNEASPATNEALKIAIERNDHLSLFMRNFADVIRLPEPRKEVFDLVEILKKTAQLMEYKAQQRDIQFVFEQTFEQPISIKADIPQMEQVFINIFKNAMEAIGKKGIITIRTNSHENQLEIEDTGKGIPPQVEKLLFSPFFSTKTYGQGIGLTLIRDILTHHNFKFSLKSHHSEKVNKTIFRIIFV